MTDAIEQQDAAAAVIPMVTAADLAQHFQVDRQTVRVWIERGDIPEPIRVSRRLLRWPVQTINDWITAGCPSVRKQEQKR